MREYSSRASPSSGSRGEGRGRTLWPGEPFQSGGVEPVVELLDELHGARVACGLLDLLARRVTVPVRDVLGYRALEEDDLLRDDADLLAEGADPDAGDVRPVDEDASLVGIEEAGDEREEEQNL